MKNILITIAVLMLMLTACSQNGPSANTETGSLGITHTNTEKAISLDCRKPSDSKEADQVMEAFATGINEKDAERLLTCVEPYDRRIDGLQKAIDYFTAYFEQQPVTAYEFVGKDDNGAYLFSLLGSNDKKKNVKVTKTDGSFTIGFDNFVRYAAYAEDKATALTGAIVNRDVPKVSFHIWNSMEPVNEKGELGIYPKSQSEKVIAKYEDFFDLTTLSVEFTGKTTLENGDGSFIYAVKGQKDNRQKQHELRIFYGDGQVGVEDEWIPAMYSEQVQQTDLLDMTAGTVEKDRE